MPHPGGVLLFLGEGGERAMVRRTQAIATHKHADLGLVAERLRLCFRMPQLAAPAAGHQLQAVEHELAAHPAALVILDPLYLAAGGARQLKPPRHGAR